LFSTINNYGINTEIALFNDKSFYEFYETHELILDWNNWNGKKKYLDTGYSYKITTLIKPIILIINERYKDKINNLIKKIFINN